MCVSVCVREEEKLMQKKKTLLNHTMKTIVKLEKKSIRVDKGIYYTKQEDMVKLTLIGCFNYSKSHAK